MHVTPDAPLKGRAAGSHAQSLRPLTAHARSDSDASSWHTHGCPQLTMDMHTGVIDARHGWRAEQRTSAPLNSVPATRGSCQLLPGSFGTQLPRVVLLLEKGGPGGEKTPRWPCRAWPWGEAGGQGLAARCSVAESMRPQDKRELCAAYGGQRAGIAMAPSSCSSVTMAT